ncbi:uncharacterized protein YrzB (UPF0473 family) [Clostridium acetobutylicum]|uniref:DUF1292 domain-containing protein n=1 Tax=Clostridium acetobutylicum (strain ATCC 824 / DSM 792 / JCM 1419 / IAM 19013 / LMG 5710 / NBRC 13948 / NRRL B-527 / VKM B-1787 / 2291 / W) TaxID=272562 RepID=Q97GY7_CLOAB|nr:MULTISPECIES: DUF1292 domain-containing protein [Clostridium]AAK80185.1 Hypothetical protein CA_C2228 [Clostridium acetobutylicum ATCC 824]ADZ21279.1 Conserved hypothetical protein [Clostridium acetobutylicum EA 2018]AEI32242.1 hypothetical protein SMB_G2261 [Clostridium acetobutylicum DSM 1731]AWV79390.1 DUF1292 domain-containing protein [Clostridium acetobutylicum]KHD38371.1 hypothetical protein NL50_02365 [Clostridium acetobutylicum]
MKEDEIKNSCEGNCGCGDEGHNHDHDHSCDCGCDSCGSEEAMVVDLEDENGNVVSCQVVDGFAFNDNEYALVQNPENDSVYLFKVIGEGENGELVIPDDEEFEAATKYYENAMNQNS